MATGSTELNRYVDCNGRQGVNKTISYTASARTSVTATTMEYPETPSGYIAIMCGMYVNGSQLLHVFCAPEASGSGTLFGIRNVASSAKSSSTSFNWTYIRADMVEDQRSLTTYDNTGISSSTGNVAIQNRKLLLRRYSGSIASLAGGSSKRILPGNMSPAYYIPTGYYPIAVTRFTTGSQYVVLDYIYPTNQATQSSSYFVAVKNVTSTAAASSAKIVVDILFAPSDMVER